MSAQRTVITIGNFDGVHVGHAALVKRASEIAAHHDAKVVVMAFDPHPLSRLRPEAAPARLTRFDDRADLLRAAGADEVVRLEPSDDLLGLTPAEFVRSLLLPLSPAVIVEGADFHFGKGRAGNVRVLAGLGSEHGFAVEVVPAVEVALTDHLMVTASSTIARWLINNGRMRDAEIVLGRPYAVRGTVVRGDQRGRTIGFPTANVQTEVLLPGNGVYAGIARLDDGREFGAAINVGTRPTFDGQGRRLEAHLLGAGVSDLPEYGWPVSVDITDFLRDDVRFDSVGRLVAQIERDCAAARVMIDDRRGAGVSGDRS